MARKSRSLNPDDQALWKRVIETAKPLRPEKRAQGPSPQVKSQPPVSQESPRIQDFRIGQKASARGSTTDMTPTLADRLSSAPVQMDQKSFGRMKRGKLQPERRIDLHGMTVAQAHGALNAFIFQSHSAGHRLVLVITGKGRTDEDSGPIPMQRGVLKNQIPQWLAMPPLQPMVLQVREAHRRHGGSGAYYVYLRRNR